MSSQFVNYIKKVLTCADHNALATALLTIHREGMGYNPRERNSGDLFWNNYRYSIGLTPGDRSFIVINVGDQTPGPFPLFSVNKSRQTVTWKNGSNAGNVTPVPLKFRPFLVELTDTLHDIHAEQTEVLELKRKTEEKAKKSYEGIDAEMDVTRKMIEGKKVAQARPQRNLKQKLLCHKIELDDAVGLMHWKVIPLDLPAAHAVDEKPTEVGHAMLESAKRGPNHGLCVVCDETLRFCTHNGCTMIGCIHYFNDELTMCANCSSTVCCANHALIECSTCENLVRGRFDPLICGISDISLKDESYGSPSSSTSSLAKKPKEEEMS